MFSNDNLGKPLAGIEVNIAPKGKFILLWIVVYLIIVSTLSTSIFMGMSAWQATLSMLFGTLALVFLAIRKGRYDIFEKGIQYSTRPFLIKNKWDKPTFINWEDIQSYNIAENLGRSGIYKTIEINGKQAKIKFQSNGMRLDNGPFAEFESALQNQIEKYNLSVIAHKGNKDIILRGNDFYKTPLGIVTAAFFTIVSGFILHFMLNTGFSGASGWFKLIFIIVPGTAYMWYRIFRKTN